MNLSDNKKFKIEKLIRKRENNISRQQLLAHKINAGQKARKEYTELDEENDRLSKKIAEIINKKGQ